MDTPIEAAKLQEEEEAIWLEKATKERIPLVELEPDSAVAGDVELMNETYKALNVESFAKLRLNQLIKRLQKEQELREQQERELQANATTTTTISSTKEQRWRPKGSNEEGFETAVALKAWLRSKGVGERKASEAASVLFEKDFDSPSSLIGISPDVLHRNGLSDAAAQTLSNKLAKPQQQQRQNAPTQKKQKVLELVEFKPDGKKVLQEDKLAKKVGGLLDRQNTIQQVYRGLEKMAKKMGTGTEGSLVDKKSVPVIGIIGKSETGKTELLRWVFNNCCTFQEAPADAKTLVQRLNQALPNDVAPLQSLLVLFASFNQTSPYLTDEGPIIETTMERLLRSFHGNVKFGSDKIRYKGFETWKDITGEFRNASGNTGFIFLLDELSKVKDKNELAYRDLMDSILGFSQECLQDGIFCAVIGSSLSVYDLGNVVITRSRRPIEPVSFPREMPEMEEKTRKILHDETGIFAGFEGHRDHVEFNLLVSMKVTQSSSSVKSWEPYVFSSPTRGTIVPPNIHYTMPTTMDADYVFLLVSRTVLKREIAENLKETAVKAIVDHLSGNLVVETNEEGLVTDWDNPRGTLSLPGWRLLEFGVTKLSPQLFKLVQNWVLVETRNMFYMYGADATTKTWEITIMALLELRKAMLQAVNGAEPSLGDLIEGVRVHHNLSQELLDMKASPHPAAGHCCRLPYPAAVINKPTIFLSSVSNEKAVEGVLQECFKDGTIFFQMKLYRKVGASQISSWLNTAHERARVLGYKQGKSIVQLFVTGVIDNNVEDAIDEWPANSMVFSDNALTDLFEPFGEGYIKEIVRRIKRDE